MKVTRFYDIDHAQHQLQNCLVRHLNRPAWVSDIEYDYNGKLSACFTYTDTHAYSNSPLYSDKWNFTPIDLGFTVSNEELTDQSRYIVRVPERMWKIGLAPGNTMYVERSEYALNKNIPLIGMSHKDIGSVPFALMVLNKYPTFKLARVFSKTGKRLVAFHKNWAIEDNYIFYKWIDVPVGNMNVDNIDLFDRYQYLQQCMQEDLAWKM